MNTWHVPGDSLISQLLNMEKVYLHHECRRKPLPLFEVTNIQAQNLVAQWSCTFLIHQNNWVAMCLRRKEKVYHMTTVFPMVRLPPKFTCQRGKISSEPADPAVILNGKKCPRSGRATALGMHQKLEYVDK